MKYTTRPLPTPPVVHVLELNADEMMTLRRLVGALNREASQSVAFGDATKFTSELFELLGGCGNGYVRSGFTLGPV